MDLCIWNLNLIVFVAPEPNSILYRRLFSTEMAAGVFCWRYLNLHKEKVLPSSHKTRYDVHFQSKSATSPDAFLSCHCCWWNNFSTRACLWNIKKHSTIFLSTARRDKFYDENIYFPAYGFVTKSSEFNLTHLQKKNSLHLGSGCKVGIVCKFCHTFINFWKLKQGE